MPDMTDDHDRWVERQFREAIDQFSEMESRLHALTGKGDLLDDYGVEVVVGPIGSSDATARVKEINLTSKALGFPPERLTAFILRSIREAEADYANKMESVLRAGMGNTATVNQAAEELHSLYPEPEPENEPATSWNARNTPRGSSDDDDDDGGWNGPILRS